MRDERLALFLQQRDQVLLLGDKGVDLGGLAVEEGGDGGLFTQWRKAKPQLWNILHPNVELSI